MSDYEKIVMTFFIDSVSGVFILDGKRSRELNQSIDY